MRNLTHLRWIGFLSLGLIAAGSVAGIIIPRGIGLDFANFYDAGQKALSGQYSDLYDPFARIGGREPLGHMTFFSAPIASFLLAPLAFLPPYTALVAFKIQSTACIWASLVILYRHLRNFVGATEEDRTVFFAAFAVSALFFQPFWTVYRVGGQTTPLVLLLLICGLVLFTRRAAWIPAACYVAVVLIKPVFVPGLAFLFIVSNWRFRLATLTIGGVAAVVSFALVGFEPHFALLEKLAVESGRIPQPHFNAHMFNWVEPLFLSMNEYATLDAVPTGLKLLTTGLRLAVIGSLALMVLRLARTDAPQAARRHFTFVASMLVPLIFTPVSWGHYVSIFFVPLAYMFAFKRYFPRPALAALAVAVLASVFHNLLLVFKIIKWTGLDTWGEMFAMAAVRSLTMLLIVAVMLIWSRNYLRTCSDPVWRA